MISVHILKVKSVISVHIPKGSFVISKHVYIKKKVYEINKPIYQKVTLWVLWMSCRSGREQWSLSCTCLQIRSIHMLVVI